MTKIIHIVLFKLAPSPQMSAESIKAGIQGLLSVPGPIKSSLGEPKIADRAKGFDYGFYSIFESMETLKKYAVSDEHMKIVTENIRPNVSDILAYDFEIDE